MSAPNPDSVSTYPSGPTSFSATWSATIDEFPCAMFPNGPACTNAGVPSSVCIRLGMMVSFISTVSAPPTPISSAVIGFAGAIRADHHAAQPLAHIGEAGRQAPKSP